MAHYLLKHESLFVGPSAGLNVVGALWLAKLLGPGHTIVTVLCDGGGNYRSKCFNPQWLTDVKIPIEKKTVQQFLDAFDESKIKIQIPAH